MFRIGLSGLKAATTDLQATGNNIANSATIGFKESRAEFGDIYSLAYNYVSSTSTGSGVSVASVTQQFNQGNIEYSENALDLAITGDGFFVLDSDGETVYSRAGAFQVDSDGYVVNSSGQKLQVFPPNDEGVTDTTFNTGVLEDLKLEFSDQAPLASTEVVTSLNLIADAEQPVDAAGDPLDFDMTDADTYNYSTSLTVYDSLGTERTATIYFVKGEDPLTWTGYVSVDGSDPVEVEFEFDSNGQLVAPEDLQEIELDMEAIDPINGATIGPIDPDTGEGTNIITFDFSGVTQYGDSYSVSDLTQDGYTTGRLSGFEVDDDGVVFARYTNGQSAVLGKVALANFHNPQGLKQLGDNTWGAAYASGEPIYGEPGSNSLGYIQSEGLEASNVDLATELVDLITAQRNYQANAKTISTADELTQTIMNMA